MIRIAPVMRVSMRYLWASPTTAVGVVVLAAGSWRMQARVVDGVLEAHGPALAWMLRHFTGVRGGAAAMTLGHIVIGRDDQSLDSTRVHERAHVRQCEVWGPLFIPTYLASSLVAWLRGRDLYFDNRFEVEAFRAEREQPQAQAEAKAPKRARATRRIG